MNEKFYPLTSHVPGTHTEKCMNICIIKMVRYMLDYNGNYKVIELCIFCLGGNENIQQNGT